MSNRNAERRIERVVIVGAGYFSQFHLHGWRTVPNVSVVAICDLDNQRAAQMAQQFGVPTAIDSTDDLFARGDFDLLDIATKPNTHRALIEKAMAARVPTICQKPFTLDYHEALATALAAEKAGVPLVVHENFRFMPWFRHLKQLLDQGLLGVLHNISFRLRTGDGQGQNAYQSRQPYFQTMPRLLVVETAVHFIDTFRYLFGEVHAVYARLRRLNPAIAGEDSGFIHFEFANGAAGCFDGNRLNDHVADNPRRTLGEMWIEGAKGVIRLDGNASLYFKPHGQSEEKLSYSRGDDDQFGGGACGALQAHVVAALRSGQQPENTALKYIPNLLIQEAVYASHEQGQRILIDQFQPPDRPLVPVY